MASRSTIEGNNIILKFMRGEHDGKKVVLSEFDSSIVGNQGLYDSSWDWLMPVVHEINQISIADLDHIQGSAKIKVKYSLYCYGEKIGIKTFDLKSIWESVVDFCVSISNLKD